MNYTIASLRTHGGEFVMDFGKDGNKYSISIHDRQSGVIRTRLFQNVNEAAWKFSELAKWCCTGSYSFEDRRKFLFE